MAISLEWLGSYEKAIDVCRQVVDTYREDSTPALRKTVADALTVMAYNLERLGRGGEAKEVSRQAEAYMADLAQPSD